MTMRSGFVPFGVLVVSASLALIAFVSTSAQGLDPAEKPIPLPSVESQPPLQDGPLSASPPDPDPDPPLGRVGDFEIRSNPNAPQEADAIMDNMGNTGPSLRAD